MNVWRGEEKDLDFPPDPYIFFPSRKEKLNSVRYKTEVSNRSETEEKNFCRRERRRVRCPRDSMPASPGRVAERLGRVAVAIRRARGRPPRLSFSSTEADPRRADRRITFSPIRGGNVFRNTSLYRSRKRWVRTTVSI